MFLCLIANVEILSAFSDLKKTNKKNIGNCIRNKTFNKVSFSFVHCRQRANERRGYVVSMSMIDFKAMLHKCWLRLFPGNINLTQQSGSYVLRQSQLHLVHTLGSIPQHFNPLNCRPQPHKRNWKASVLHTKKICCWKAHILVVILFQSNVR